MPTSVSVRVQASRPYEVRIGAGLLAEVEGATRAFAKRAILTDEIVAPLYATALDRSGRLPVHSVPAGEASKTFAGLERVLDFMASAALDRSSCLIALGGGVIGDLGGLAASLFQRGIAVVQCPTTLLAQVDSSVGGKTAVNLRSGKNLAGTFHQPSAVFADTRALATLPEAELRSGLGEVVKSALIAGEEQLAFLEREAASILARDPDVLARVVASCVETKAAIVARDERESGERKLLNLGHTFGHAIEHAAGFGRIPHGVAVAVGIALASSCSAELELLADAELPGRTRRLLAKLGLPASLAALREATGLALEPERLLSGMRHDKKGGAGEPRFVLPLAAGRLARDVAVERKLLEALLARS